MSVPAKPLDITLEIAPKARFDVVDLRSHFAAEHEALDRLSALPVLVVSHHGRVSGPQSGRAAERPAHSDLRRRRPHVLSRRAPATSTTGWSVAATSTRRSGRSSRATPTRTWRSSPAGCAPASRTRTGRASTVYFVDLDGVNDGRPRRRLTRLIAFTRERVVSSTRIEVPVSEHPIDSVNLKDPRLGIYAQLAEFVKEAGVAKGRLRVSLDPTERHSALTVNEYETLLMRYDLAEVLRNPLRFVAEKSRHALANPRAVPAKTLGYAKYDMVRVLNKGLDALGLRGSIVEKAMARTLAVPAARFFRMRRSVSLLVSADDDGQPSIVEGTYQSPILVQWQNAPRQARVLERLDY